MWEFVHVNSRCGHMSVAWFGHNIHYGFGLVVGQYIYFPMVSHILDIVEF